MDNCAREGQEVLLIVPLLLLQSSSRIHSPDDYRLSSDFLCKSISVCSCIIIAPKFKSSFLHQIQGKSGYRGHSIMKAHPKCRLQKLHGLCSSPVIWALKTAWCWWIAQSNSCEYRSTSCGQISFLVGEKSATILTLILCRLQCLKETLIYQAFSKLNS